MALSGTGQSAPSLVVGLTLKCQLKRYPCCHHVLLLMLSKNVGGKFKYLNRKNSEFLAGNSNANAKCKCKMQNAKCKMQNAKCKMQMQNAKCKMQNAKCKMQNAKCKCKLQNANANCKMQMQM